MGFVHGYLLAGLVLAGLPVVFHLLMRQKPRRVKFPAIRFLMEKMHSNQRRLRLQHLLLLMLRMLVIALVCLALARPQITASNFFFDPEQRIGAVLLFDTTPTMDYRGGGKTRLEEAREQASRFLDEISPASKIAVLDLSSQREEGKAREWLPDRRVVNQKIGELKTHPAAGGLPGQTAFAYRLLDSLKQTEEPLPRFLFIFSDRTLAAWEGMGIAGVKPPPGITTLYIDVGQDNPSEVAIEKLSVDPLVVEPGGMFSARVGLRATGKDHKTLVECKVENLAGEQKIQDKKSLVCPKDQSTELSFDFHAPKPVFEDPLKPSFFQVTAKLSSADAWSGNDRSYATFQVRRKARTLALCENLQTPRIWRAAVEAVGRYACDIRTVAEGEKLTAQDLSTYRSVVLFQVAAPSQALWQKLEPYVKSGGGLALVPGPGLSPVAYATPEAQILSPVAFLSLEKTPAGVIGPHLGGFDNAHTLTAPFKDWIASTDPDFNRPELRPFANGRWKVQPGPESLTVARYMIEGKEEPALVEKTVGLGHILAFTTPLDGSIMEGNRFWNNFWQDSSFGLILADRACQYLGREETEAQWQFISGQPTMVELPLPPWRTPFELSGPGLTATETVVSPKAGATTLFLPQAVEPGHYQLLDAVQRPIAYFSINLNPKETRLDRVALEEVENILGKGSVVPLGKKADLNAKIKENYQPPLELLPWLLLLLPLVLALESFAANKFYRKEPAPA
ncbi:MAG: hypothetical protein EXR99_05835 [Gemmataceae bacterium]|nr:hypothetical protein [Gemmataceae bacterium]